MTTNLVCNRETTTWDRVEISLNDRELKVRDAVDFAWNDPPAIRHGNLDFCSSEHCDRAFMVQNSQDVYIVPPRCFYDSHRNCEQLWTKAIHGDVASLQ